jgi:hypothetical protein
MDALGLPEFHAVEAFVVVPAAAFVEDAFSGGER